MISDICNPITFKQWNYGYFPNHENTLHHLAKHGFRMVDKYCQPFSYNSSVLLQFISDVADVPTMKAYLSEEGQNDIDTIAGSLVATRGTDNIRYFFNFTVSLDATYKDKKVFFIINQGESAMISEPILAADYSSEIASGRLKVVEYSNYERRNSAVGNNFFDWDSIGQNAMSFLVEGSTVEVSDSDEVEILEGSQQKTVIASSLYAGINFKTDPIPDYMVRKLEAVSSLCYFAINEIQYVKEGGVTAEQVGTSTSFALSMTLKQCAAIGINVDFTGNEEAESVGSVVSNSQFAKSSDFSISRKAGFAVCFIMVKYNSQGSQNNAVITAGLSLGDDSLINATTGAITYNSGDPIGFPIALVSGMENSGNVYFTISGVGIVLDFTTVFIKTS